jgi:WD40 repeat protein
VGKQLSSFHPAAESCSGVIRTDRPSSRPSADVPWISILLSGVINSRWIASSVKLRCLGTCSRPKRLRGAPSGDLTVAETVPVFLAYREVDGRDFADLLDRALNGKPLPALSPTGNDEGAPELDVHYDHRSAPPGEQIADVNWRALRKARALILVISPGTRSREKKRDWLYAEIDWWLAHRKSARPLLVDTTGEPLRWAPEPIVKRWKDIVAVPISRDDSEGRNQRSIDLIIQGIVRGQSERVREDLRRERNRRLVFQNALAAAAMLFIFAAAAGFVAYQQRNEARRANGKLALEEGKKKIALDRAEAEATRLRRELARQLVVKSWEVFDDGDRTGALVLLAKALTLSKGDENDEPLSRMRFHALRRQFPMDQFWSDARFAAFSPDGSRIVIAGASGGLSLWDASSRRLLLDFDGHDDAVIHASFDRTGGKVLSASFDTTAVVWDSSTGQELRVLRHSAPVIRAWFTSDKTAVTATLDGVIALFDTDSGDQKTTSGSLGRFLAFSPDRSSVAVAADDHTVKLYGVGSWTQIGQPMRHFLPLIGASFSPDGLRIVTTSGVDSAARQKAVGTTLDPSQKPKGPEERVSPNEKGEARVWNARTGVEISPPMTHPSPVLHSEFSPDSQTIATASGVTRLWAITGERKGDDFRSGSHHHFATFSPDGLHVVTGSLLPASGKSEFQVWDVGSGKAVTEPLGHPSRVEFAFYSQDSRLLLGGGVNFPSTSLWDFRLLTSPSHQSLHMAGALNAVFTDEPSQIVAWSGETQVTWDLRKGDRQDRAILKLETIRTSKPLHVRELPLIQETMLDHFGRKYFVKRNFTSIGRTVYEEVIYPCPAVLTAPLLERDRLRNPSEKELRGLRLAGNVAPRAYLTGKYVLAAEFEELAKNAKAEQTRVRIWDIAKNSPITPVMLQSGHLYRATFSRDGRLVALVTGEPPAWAPVSGDSNSKPARSAPEGSQSKPRGHQPPAGIAISPEPVMQAVSHEREVRVWEVSTGQPITPPFADSPALEEFSADGRYLMTVSKRGVRVWDLLPDGALAAIDHSVTLAKIIASRDVDAAGEFAAIDYDGIEAELAAQRAEFAAQLDGTELLAWHRTEAIWAATHSTSNPQSKLLEPARAHATAWSEAEPTNPLPWSILGVVAAQQGQFADADRHLGKSVALNSDQVEIWRLLALLRLFRGDEQGYRDLCGRAHRRFKDHDSPYITDNLVWMFTLAPGQHFRGDLLLSLAEWARKEHANERVHQDTHIAVLLRAGKTAKAFEVEKERADNGITGHDAVNVLLDVAHFKQSKDELEKINIQLRLKNLRDRLSAREFDPRARRYDDLETMIFLREAESVVGKLDNVTEPHTANSPTRPSAPTTAPAP